MPREATGAIEWRKGHAFLRVRMPNGDRPRLPLGKVSKAYAEEKRQKYWVDPEGRAKTIASYLAALGEQVTEGPASSSSETVRAVGELWTSGKMVATYGRVNGLKPKASAYTDEKRLERYVYPVIGAKPIADVTEEDIEKIMRSLPASRSSATRMRIHSLLHMLFSLAEFPMRLRPEGSNPVRKWLRPAKDAPKLFGWLYPAELLSLLKCETIPLGRRVLYALAIYTGLRKGSLMALRWRGFDAHNRTLTSLKSKTGLPQLFEVPPDLAAVLTRWRKLAPLAADGDPIVQGLECPKGREAVTMRKDLRAAGITREILFSNESNVEPLRFHDFRATFVTWAKRAGHGDGWISDRTGHLTPEMRERYNRAARTLADLKIEAFPDLSGAIPELSLAHAMAQKKEAPEGTSVISVGHEGLEPSANGLRVHCSTN